MQPQNREELVSLLRAHIVADDVDQELASTIGKAKTIDGGEVDIQAENGELMVGDAKVVDAESIEMDSLRIYPIDGVLAANASAGGALDDTSRDSSRTESTQPTETERTRQQTQPQPAPGSQQTQPRSQQTQPAPGSQQTQPRSQQTQPAPGSNPASPPPSDRPR
jgi:glucan-binding YG repeat protein